MPTLTIIRGLPGSGKSTLAKSIAQMNNAAHYEADQFFHLTERHQELPVKTIILLPDIAYTQPYKYSQKYIAKAHLLCLKRTEIALLYGLSAVVANTFTTKQEMEPYLTLLNKNSISIIHAKGTYQSIHNVPEHIINHMKTRWEEL